MILYAVLRPDAFSGWHTLVSGKVSLPETRILLMVLIIGSSRAGGSRHAGRDPAFSRWRARRSGFLLAQE